MRGRETEGGGRETTVAPPKQKKRLGLQTRIENVASYSYFSAVHSFVPRPSLQVENVYGVI